MKDDDHKEWSEELIPGIYRIGNDASDTGGNEAVLIKEHNFLIFTDGYDYGSWIGEVYELTPEEVEQVMNWKEGSYDLRKWLESK